MSLGNSYFQYLLFIPVIAILTNIVLKYLTNSIKKEDWLVCYELFLASIAALVAFFISSKQNIEVHSTNKNSIESIMEQNEKIECLDCTVVLDSLQIWTNRQTTLVNDTTDASLAMIFPIVGIFVLMIFVSGLIKLLGTEKGELTAFTGIIIPDIIGFSTLYYTCYFVTSLT